MDKPTVNTIACSYVASRLDYCNAVLVGISEHNIMRLQRVQNNAARIVADTHIKEGTSKILQELHWLPVAKRIEYKIILTVYKTLQTRPLILSHC